MSRKTNMGDRTEGSTTHDGTGIIPGQQITTERATDAEADNELPDEEDEVDDDDDDDETEADDSEAGTK